MEPDQLISQLQDMFPDFSKRKLIEVLESQQFNLNTSINALLTMSPDDDTYAHEPAQPPTTLNNPRASSPSLPLLPTITMSLAPSLPLNPGSNSNSNPNSNANSSHVSPVQTSLPPLPYLGNMKIGLGRLGFGLHHHEFADKNEELNNVFQKYAGLGATVMIALQWQDSEFGIILPTLLKIAKQSGLATGVALTITSETQKGVLEIQYPKSLQITGKPSFANKALSDNLVETACLIAQSKPNYLCLAVDFNAFVIGRSEEYQKFLPVYKAAYREVKKISPQTNIFVSFQYEMFLQMPDESSNIIFEFKPELDILAINSRPYEIYDSVSAIPSDYYKNLSRYLTEGLPIMISEIDWPATSGSEGAQEEFLRKLPAFFEGINPIGLIWALLTDVDAKSVKSLANVANCGLIQQKGTKKLAFAEWEKLQKFSPKPETKGHKRATSDQFVAPLPPSIAQPAAQEAPASLPPIQDADEQALADVLTRNPQPSTEPAKINIDFSKLGPHVTFLEAKPYIISHAIPKIVERSSYPDIYVTGWSDLVVARVAYLIAEDVYERLEKEGVLLDNDKNPTNFFDATKIEGFILNCIDKHIQAVLKDRSWLERKKEQYKGTRPVKIETNEDQGPRPGMEDREICYPFLNELMNLEKSERIQLYGVFDGHGGYLTAEYIAIQLPYCILRNYQSNPDIKQALRVAFLETDWNYTQHAARVNLPTGMGSTAVVMLIIGDQMYVCWVGDSEACLVNKGGDVFPFVTCHKPKFESERQRIEQKGGFVTEVNGLFRVNGLLAVSRAFGDLQLKSVVTAEPELASYKFKGDENYLLLACDGLWDVLSPFDVEELIDNHKSKFNGYDGVTKQLNTEARRRASTDNITIVFVNFQ